MLKEITKTTEATNIAPARRAASESPDMWKDQRCTPLARTAPRRVKTRRGTAILAARTYSGWMSPPKRSSSAPYRLQSVATASKARMMISRTLE